MFWSCSICGMLVPEHILIGFFQKKILGKREVFWEEKKGKRESFLEFSGSEIVLASVCSMKALSMSTDIDSLLGSSELELMIVIDDLPDW
ncbi:hypothetical protein AYI70_g1973 [Smittium culicis]|uniref:Uncharacterized protein n=1 Tax=Smittium culicis TaxID=133412 RepID=A0A1R1YAF9_9FUNG|nr:hypothetical protein AYI70_g1973 [Smittium culicis]